MHAEDEDVSDVQRANSQAGDSDTDVSVLEPSLTPCKRRQEMKEYLMSTEDTLKRVIVQARRKVSGAHTFKLTFPQVRAACYLIVLILQMIIICIYMVPIQFVIKVLHIIITPTGLCNREPCQIPRMHMNVSRA